jgi:hypothetical protein
MPVFTRRPDWTARLAAFLEERSDRPFAWGTNCCASFAIAWVETMTGRTPFAVDWTAAASAEEKRRAVGGMRQAWREALGPEQQNWRTIRRGDVALVDIDGRDCGVICTGTTLAGPGVERMVHLPLDRAVLVWRIG